MKFISFLVHALSLFLFLFLCLTGFMLWENSSDHRDQEELLKEISCYRPQNFEETQSNESLNPDSTGTEILQIVDEEEPDLLPPIINQSIADMQGLYPDVCGWLTLEDTDIDYPFVQSSDNDDYLKADLNGDYNINGTPFIDYRCVGLESRVTIIYGHHMKDGSMFASLLWYGNEDHWDKEYVGTVLTPTHTFQLKPIAYLVVQNSDDNIYSPFIYSDEEMKGYLEYVKDHARIYRETKIAEEDNILVLSTCNYEFTGARSVLIIKMVEK